MAFVLREQTMIDLATENIRSLAQAAKLIPSNKTTTVSPCTVWRWCTTGVRALDGRQVKLDAIRIGGRWVTSVEAIDRFSRDLTGVAAEDEVRPTPSRSPSKRQSASARAAEKLQAAGI